MSRRKINFFILLCLLFCFTACGSKTVNEVEQADSDNKKPLFGSHKKEDYFNPGDISYDVEDYVSPGDYKGLKIDRKEVLVTEEEIEAAVSEFTEDHAVLKNVTGKIEDGMYVNVDYSLVVEDEYLGDYSGSNKEIVMGYGFICDEVDRALHGHKVGDYVNARLVLDYNFGDYEGKEASYVVKVNAVYRYEAPELTDLLVMENTEYDSVEDFRLSIKNDLLAKKESESRNLAGEQALLKLVESADFKGYPDSLYAYIEENVREIQSYYADWFGVEPEELFTEEELSNYILLETKKELLVEAILRKEELMLTKEDHENYLNDCLSFYGYDSVEALLKDFKEYDLFLEARRERAMDFLLSEAKLTILSPEAYDNKYGES